MSDRVDVSFTISKKFNGKIKHRVQQISGSEKDFYAEALSLFLWAIDEVEKGNSIGSMNIEESKFKEIVTPIIDDHKKALQ